MGEVFEFKWRQIEIQIIERQLVITTTFQQHEHAVFALIQYRIIATHDFSFEQFCFFFQTKLEIR